MVIPVDLKMTSGEVRERQVKILVLFRRDSRDEECKCNEVNIDRGKCVNVQIKNLRVITR